MRRLVVLVIALALVSLAMAQENPKPVLYGQAFDGITAADGATVTIYPQASPQDTLTDTVGVTGSSGTESYWKANLYNLNTDVQDDDIIIINLTQEEKDTQRTYIVDLSEGIYLINTMNLDPSYQDYDEDGFNATVDCDDNSNDTYPGAIDEFGDGIDQDCNGFDGINLSEVINITAGWNVINLSYAPTNINDSEQLAASIDANCSVVMNLEQGVMKDDIIGLDDPTLDIIKGEIYYIHCEGEVNFSYEGEN